jgi:hypothetical protein
MTIHYHIVSEIQNILPILKKFQFEHEKNSMSYIYIYQSQLLFELSPNKLPHDYCKVNCLSKKILINSKI